MLRIPSILFLIRIRINKKDRIRILLKNVFDYLQKSYIYGIFLPNLIIITRVFLWIKDPDPGDQMLILIFKYLNISQIQINLTNVFV